MKIQVVMGALVKRGLQERGWEDLGSGAPLGVFYFRSYLIPFHSAKSNHPGFYGLKCLL